MTTVIDSSICLVNLNFWDLSKSIAGEKSKINLLACWWSQDFNDLYLGFSTTKQTRTYSDILLNKWQFYSHTPVNGCNRKSKT